MAIYLVVSLISVLIITSVSLYATLWGLRLRGQIAQKKFIGFVLASTIGVLLVSILASILFKTSNGLDLIIVFVPNIIISYLLAKYYFRIDKDSVRFAIYYTLISVFLVVTIGLIISTGLFAFLSASYNK